MWFKGDWEEMKRFLIALKRVGEEAKKKGVHCIIEAFFLSDSINDTHRIPNWRDTQLFLYFSVGSPSFFIMP